MKPVAVFYATREGHTRKIADHIARRLESRGLPVDLRNIKIGANPGDLCRYSAIALAASVHGGSHEQEMACFAKAHREQLDNLPAWFFSVTLSQAGAQRSGDPPERHQQFVADVDQMVAKFCADTGWLPRHIVPVAGALCYSKYNFLVRFIMKRIAAKAGADTDTSRDYEYTDWVALDRAVDQMADEVLDGAAPAQHELATKV
ncbi:MAG TPA: flavodoxin domain-containing protein [Candidatus Angelobacter sp.]|nr:flavodoxin domain-containing protein [Candidatus Angelobacter sp.]